MPRGCQLAFHSERAGDETDSAIQRFVRPPSDIYPDSCRAGCFFWRAKVRYGRHEGLAGFPPRHNPGRLSRNQDDAVGVRALPAGVEGRR